MINTQPKTADAIRSLDPHSEFSIREGVITWITTPIDEAKIATEMARLKTVWDSQDYVRKRKAEYDQLNQYEMMFDDKRDGTTTWVDKINEIKNRHPKND